MAEQTQPSGRGSEQSMEQCSRRRIGSSEGVRVEGGMSCAGSERDWKVRPLAEGPSEQLRIDWIKGWETELIDKKWKANP